MPTADRDCLLARAAALRVAGASWETVGREVGRAATTCREWPERFPDQWRTARLTAERELLHEIGAEAVLVLRQLLRAEDEKVRRDAARTLLDRCPAADANTDAGPPSKWSALAHYLETLDAAQVAALLPRRSGRRADDGPPAPPH